jgi:hypothetical protein
VDSLPPPVKEHCGASVRSNVDLDHISGRFRNLNCREFAVRYGDDMANSIAKIMVNGKGIADLAIKQSAGDSIH